MLQITVTNKNQRLKHKHADGALTLGRALAAEGHHLFVDDVHVSRQQLKLEETADGRVRLANLGRQVILLPHGKNLAQDDETVLSLPARLTVGGTVLEINFVSSETSQPTFEATLLNADTHSTQLPLMTLLRTGKAYPFPLAYGLRLLGSITTPAELYKEELRLAENLLAFVASVSLSLLDDDGIGQVNEKIEGTALSCWQGGISPGDWLSLAIHAIDQLFDDGTDSIADGLKNLHIHKDNRGFGKTVRDLIKAKNDYKHDRGPSIESEFRAASASAGEMLKEAFRHLSFFTEHPVRLVQDVNPRRRGQTADVVFLNCMGDHPGFSSQTVVLSQVLHKGDLYLEREPGRLVSLYPFMHAATCSQCKAREIYFVDRLDADRSKGHGYVAGLKSYDKGHTEPDPNVGEEMMQIFGAD